ncbi:MAG: hypothetical protein GDA49_01405 [Rhodospirillales bacterium]|nr:hypothetical protein [Rhodospirillales bacterium]
MLRIVSDGAADGVTIRISRFGGITRARQVCDLAVEAGLMVIVACIGGAEIIPAAMAHMSLSTPACLRAHTVDFHNRFSVSNAVDFREVRGGRMQTPYAAGLGVASLREQFGAPIPAFDLGGHGA